MVRNPEDQDLDSYPEDEESEDLEDADLEDEESDDDDDDESDEEESDSDDDDDEDEDEDDEPDSDEEEKPKKKKRKKRTTRKVQVDPICYSKQTRPIDPNLPKNYYFDNNYVEKLLTEYVMGGCTDVDLRDEIMSNAEELIKQIIRTHKLHLITNGREGTAFGDLYQLAWVQIESSLYKFDFRPGHTKVFNMWSQVAKTVMLAHIKKESRDKRNYGAYKEHLDGRKGPSRYKFDRFIEEARDVCKHHGGHNRILEALENLFETDNRPYDGLIDKLCKRSGMSRSKVSNFLRMLRLRSYEFTDSPLNEELPKGDSNKYRVMHHNYESDED